MCVCVEGGGGGATPNHDLRVYMCVRVCVWVGGACLQTTTCECSCVGMYVRVGGPHVHDPNPANREPHPPTCCLIPPQTVT